MTLTWKDLVTTILTALTIGFSYLMVTGYKFPLISNYRWATLVLLILGMGMCILSSAGPGSGGIFITMASVLGIVALILIIAGFIFGTQILFLGLTAVIVLLWFISTLRHLLQK